MKKGLVVVTGASSGFGLEIAKLFNQEGYPLLLIARRIEKLKALNLSNTLCIKADVQSYNEFQAAIKAGVNIYGPVDLLINNAGVMLLGNIENQDTSEWKTMLDTNVIGVLNGMKIVLEDMKQRKGGTIINISSIAGKKTFLNHAAYCATKYGVHALTETVREEVSAHNVRVSLIAPGAAETELLSHTTDQNIINGYNEWKATMGGVSLDPKHIASCALFIYQMPQESCIREIDITATKQNS